MTFDVIRIRKLSRNPAVKLPRFYIAKLELSGHYVLSAFIG